MLSIQISGSDQCRVVQFNITSAPLSFTHVQLNNRRTERPHFTSTFAAHPSNISEVERKHPRKEPLTSQSPLPTICSEGRTYIALLNSILRSIIQHFVRLLQHFRLGERPINLQYEILPISILRYDFRILIGIDRQAVVTSETLCGPSLCPTSSVWNSSMFNIAGLYLIWTDQ